MTFLAGLRHSGIVKLVSFTTVSTVSGYGVLPFYVMEAVDGSSSKNFVFNPQVSELQFLKLVCDTVTVIRYLHSHAGVSFAHLDIKPENCLDGIKRQAFAAFVQTVITAPRFKREKRTASFI